MRDEPKEGYNSLCNTQSESGDLKVAKRKVLIDDYDKAAKTKGRTIAFKTLRCIYTKKTLQVEEKTKQF